MHPGLNVYKEPVEAWKTVEDIGDYHPYFAAF